MKRYLPMTLGDLIDKIQSLGDEPMQNIVEAASYRGYYRDLGFEVTDRMVPASLNLQLVTDCVGRTFEGWKGGDFTMDLHTQVWVHIEGTTAGSGRIVDIVDGEFIVVGDVW